MYFKNLKYYSVLFCLIFHIYGCGSFTNNNQQCYIGKRENQLDKKDKFTIKINDKNNYKQIVMNEGWAFIDNLDSKKLAITVFKAPEINSDFEYNLSMLLPVKDEFPFTYYFDYDKNDINKTDYNYFIHGTSYTEEKACRSSKDPRLMFPKIENGIQYTKIKGYIIIDEIGEIGNFIKGSINILFKDQFGNAREIKSTGFQITRELGSY